MPAQIATIPKLLKIAPWLIAWYAGAVSISPSRRALSDYATAAEARHIAEVRAVEHEKALRHAEEIQSARILRDSVLRFIPKKKIRRVSDAVLQSALNIAKEPTEDTIGRAWILIAQAEVARRARIHQAEDETLTRRAQSAARRQALLESQREYVRRAAVPDGASAMCRDGSYSFSAHRSGTCSHHGGVAVWY